MNKRASLPGASELFRPTKSPAVDAPTRAAEPEVADAEAVPTPTGRVKHDHKITVYFSEEELNALEDANLALRRAHGIRVDRGRLVRVAVARAVADLVDNGDESFLVAELRAQ